jgi:hypothetical protein
MRVRFCSGQLLREGKPVAEVGSLQGSCSTARCHGRKEGRKEDMTRPSEILITRLLLAGTPFNQVVAYCSAVRGFRIAPMPWRVLLNRLGRCLFVAGLLAGSLWGQQPSPEFTTSSIANYGPDSVDLQTLVPSVNLPIRAKRGALPFSASVAIQSTCYMATGTSGIGIEWYCNPFWPFYGNGYLPLAANTSASVRSGTPTPYTTCPQSGNNLVSTVGNWYITDSVGLSQHQLSPSLTLYDSYCPGSITGTTIDGSGITATISQTWNGKNMTYSATIVDKMGNTANMLSSTVSPGSPVSIGS